VAHTIPARAWLTDSGKIVGLADEVRDLVERMLKSSGRRVDLSSPFVDATLPDGLRLHVVIPDITGTVRKCPQASKFE
jgi:pilus assembly protein CpaF